MMELLIEIFFSNHRTELCSRDESSFSVLNIPGQVENSCGDEKWASPSKVLKCSQSFIAMHKIHFI